MMIMCTMAHYVTNSVIREYMAVRYYPSPYILLAAASEAVDTQTK